MLALCPDSKKNLTCGGWDRPHGIVWEVEWPSHSRPRKSPNPCPTRTRGPVALWVRPGSTVLWTWDKRGSFFNPRAEIRPRGGSNPGPLGSASSGATTTVAGLWRRNWLSIYMPTEVGQKKSWDSCSSCLSVKRQKKSVRCRSGVCPSYSSHYKTTLLDKNVLDLYMLYLALMVPMFLTCCQRHNRSRWRWHKGAAAIHQRVTLWICTVILCQCAFFPSLTKVRASCI